MKLRQVMRSEFKNNKDNERLVLDEFDKMLEEIEMLCQSNKIRRHSNIS